MKYNCPVVAIVGRANVGKSTLFNSLSNTMNALVANVAGLTRDRQYASCEYRGQPYILVDTAGIESVDDYENNTKTLYKRVLSQVELAIKEADFILFVVDAKVGVNSQDIYIADVVRLCNKPVFLVINKAERSFSDAPNDFYELGFVNNYPVSASHRKGLGNLMEHVLSLYPYEKNENTLLEPNSQTIKFAIVGKPNVGKSTLVNALLKEDRMVVADLAGTTRDSVSIDFQSGEHKFTIVDTAGIRKKSKVHDVLEKFSILKVLKTISMCEIVVVLLDATVGVKQQDISVLNYAVKAGKPIIVAVNKLDLLSTEEKKNIKQTIKKDLHFVQSSQFVYLAAAKSKGLDELLQAVINMHKSLNIKLSTPKLTRILQEAIKRQPVPALSGVLKPKLKYAHQGGNNPLTIVIHGNRASHVPASYVKYLTNVFRQVCDLDSALILEFKDNINPFAS
jgi:GTP-binding protein